MTEDLICSSCNDTVMSIDDLCNDGYCRKCHVSLSFEECVDGSWVEKERARIVSERE